VSTNLHLEKSATEVRDLHTGTPLWLSRDRPSIPATPLRASLKTDLVIVGAGITGALLAFRAFQRGIPAVVIDRRPPGLGSTAASTALLQFEIDTPLIRLAEQIGFERASRAWLRCLRATSELAGLVRALRIPCDFTPRRALYLSGSKLNASEMASEEHWRRTIGLPSKLLSANELFQLVGIEREAALLSDGVADVDPVRLTAGLLQRASQGSVQIFSPVNLAEVVASSRGVSMVTGDGVELEAKTLVFATGYELAKGVPSAGHKRTSTWAFATPPQATTWGQCELIWEAAEPYLYLRCTADGRVVVGGEDEPFSDEAARDALIPSKLAALQQKTRRLMPWLDVTADYAWAGTFGESDDGLPSIGSVPDMPNCHAVLGYGGNGFTFGMIAAQIIDACLVGTADPDAEIFAFGRHTP
jgi:glycine/D-amino acid oxidase-like deaminating enzyme